MIGTLYLSPQQIKIEKKSFKKQIDTGEIEKINFYYAGIANKWYGNRFGGGNYIEITDKEGLELEYEIAIADKIEKNKLKAIFEHWRENNISINIQLLTRFRQF